ncbi:General amino-acid permease GAP1 [Candida viswanathii]|uniref:General amino-acid permease GAP1 n=1 Tax=Candida viswanathii TaxID=5486 RepID=A0A367YBD8_9ASCO|nr:General amino-acid permease GAP1 [Candida viswanathii]
MSSSVKNSFNQMVTVEDDSTIHRSNLSDTLSTYSSNGDSYVTSSSTSSASTYHRTPREVLEDFIDSFKSFDYSTLPPVYNNISDQESHLQVNPANPNFDYSRFTQLERDALITSCSPLSKRLRTRHLTWISLGASIGTGLLISSGSSLSHSGPLGLVLVWLFVGSVTFATMSSLSELATAFPVAGSFTTYCSLFIDKSVSFAISWNYALQWLVTLPLQIIAAALAVQYWNDSIHPAVWVTVFYVTIVVINLFGVYGYAEIEMAISIIKVIAVVGFNILAIIIVTGGVPGQPYIGAKNWQKPDGGLFNTVEPFKQLCYILSNVAFAYAGVELFGLAAVESSTPKKSINQARKQIFYRLVVFYIWTVIMIGFVVSYKLPELQDSGRFGSSVNGSPFVIAIRRAHINALPSIMNVVVILTVLSVGNASVYASTRVLCAIGALQQGPSFLSFIDKKGRPMGCLLVQFAFGLLAYLICIPGDTAAVEIFDWLLSLSGLGALFTYLSINICQLRFNSALKHQARIPKDELLYVSPLWCSWYGIVTLLAILGLQFWAALFPPGQHGADVESFFKIYLGGPVLLVCWVGHKIFAYYYHKTPLTKLWLTVDEIDVDTGRRQVDLEAVKQEIAEERIVMESKPWWYKVYKTFC